MRGLGWRWVLRGGPSSPNSVSVAEVMSLGVAMEAMMGVGEGEMG